MIDVLLADIVFDWTFLKPLIERDDGEKESNDTQQVLAQAEVSPEIYYQVKECFLLVIMDCGVITIINIGLLPYKSTSTPCSCWLCKGERYNRRKFKKETRLEIAMF